MNSALLLGLRHPLHAMHATLIFHARVDATAFNDGDNFFQAAHARFRSRKHFHLPALGLRIAVVHAKDLGSKERSFIPARSGPNFQHHVFVVIGVLGYQQHLELFFNFGEALFQTAQFLLGIFAQLGIGLLGNNGPALLNAPAKVFEFAIFLDNLREIAMSLGSLLVLG